MRCDRKRHSGYHERNEPILTAPIMALPLLLVLLFWLLFAPRKRSSAKDKTHKTH